MAQHNDLGPKEAVAVPLVTPAVLVGVEALAGVRLLQLLGLGVVVLVRPALSTAQALEEGGTELPPVVLGPEVLGGLLVAVQPLAGLVNLVDVAVPPLPAAVEGLLLLGVGPHARGLQGEEVLGLLLDLLDLLLGLERLQDLGVHAAVEEGLLGQEDVAPGRPVVGGVLGQEVGLGH